MPVTATQMVKIGIAWSGRRIPAPKIGNAVILLYHGTPRRAPAGRLDECSFEAQIRFLKKHFELIAPKELERRRNSGRPRVLLTFDDGFRNNFEVAQPILRHYGVPAAFFISSRHAQPGKYLWFAYLRVLEDGYPGTALSFRGHTFSLEGEKRRASIEQLKKILLGLKPHPQAMYEAIENELPAPADWMPAERIRDLCAGMTVEQVRELSQDPLFTIGCHSIDHPFLTQCSGLEMKRQIDGNKAWLEQVTGREIDQIAYPSGDYDANVLAACRESGFNRGYAVIPVLRSEQAYELSRIGVYRTSLEVLGFLVRWGNTLRAFRVPMG